MITRVVFFSLLLIPAALIPAQESATCLVDLNKLSYFYGREYFILRSGRAQMIIQADKADLGPAFTYLLFDAENARQSVRKELAFNFDPNLGNRSSALEVVLGGFPFTALGHRTETRWESLDGIPTVVAVWWAGGVRVTERICAFDGVGAFRRSIGLEGAHLVGEESVTLRLSLPPEICGLQDSVLLGTAKMARMALQVLRDQPVKVNEKEHRLEIGPLVIGPGRSAFVDTVLMAQVPAGKEQEILSVAADIRSTSGAAARSRTREKWDKESTVAAGDGTVREIYDKARFGLPGMVADDGTMDAGIFEYGAQWVRDTSNTTLGLIHTGEFEIARRTLERVLTKMVSREGATMIAGSFDSPDREQFDQMGELLHVLKAYRDWTGDDSLVRNHRELLLALIERPLQPRFRDETGMVHNRREFWERAFDDAYELAYQTWVVQGLRDAADLSSALGAEARAPVWRAEAGNMVNAMVSHPTRALVDNGRLIKRRNVTGEVADLLPDFKGFQPDVPGSTEKHHRLLPDASQALPIALRIVAPRSELARRTLDELEQLWNTRWSDGGYDRYHTSVQPDQPGPWPFATCFIMRAQHEAGLLKRSRRSLEWLNTMQGGRAGAWFEEIPSVRSLARSCGLVQWTSAEVVLFVIRHWLGVSFEGSRMVLRPALYADSPPASAKLRFREGRVRIEIDGSGPVESASVNGIELKPSPDGALRLPADFSSGMILIRTRRGEHDAK